MKFAWVERNLCEHCSKAFKKPFACVMHERWCQCTVCNHVILNKKTGRLLDCKLGHFSFDPAARKTEQKNPCKDHSQVVNPSMGPKLPFKENP